MDVYDDPPSRGGFRRRQGYGGQDSGLAAVRSSERHYGRPARWLRATLPRGWNPKTCVFAKRTQFIFAVELHLSIAVARCYT